MAKGGTRKYSIAHIFVYMAFLLLHESNSTNRLFADEYIPNGDMVF